MCFVVKHIVINTKIQEKQRPLYHEMGKQTTQAQHVNKSQLNIYESKIMKKCFAYPKPLVNIA